MSSVPVSGASTPSTVASKPMLSHPCFECGLMFANKDDHEHHNFVFHNPEDKLTLLVCDLCGRTYETAAQLGQHQFEHDLCVLAKALYEHEAMKILGKSKRRKRSTDESAGAHSSSTATKSTKRKLSATQLSKKSKNAVRSAYDEFGEASDEEIGESGGDAGDDEFDDSDLSSSPSPPPPPNKKSKKASKPPVASSSVSKQLAVKSTDQPKRIDKKRASLLTATAPTPPDNVAVSAFHTVSQSKLRETELLTPTGHVDQDFGKKRSQEVAKVQPKNEIKDAVRRRSVDISKDRANVVGKRFVDATAKGRSNDANKTALKDVDKNHSKSMDKSNSKDVDKSRPTNVSKCQSKSTDKGESTQKIVGENITPMSDVDKFSSFHVDKKRSSTTSVVATNECLSQLSVDKTVFQSVDAADHNTLHKCAANRKPNNKQKTPATKPENTTCQSPPMLTLAELRPSVVAPPIVTPPDPKLSVAPLTVHRPAVPVPMPTSQAPHGSVMLSSICPNCNENHGKPWSLIEHMISAHGAQLVRLERKFLAGDSAYALPTLETFGQTRCQYCSLQCDEVSVCLNHIVRLHRDKLFECAACGECEVCFELLSTVGTEVSKRKFTIRVKVKRRPSAAVVGTSQGV